MEKLILYKDVIISQGFTRGVMFDITRDKYYFIPRLWCKLIRKFDNKININELNEYVGKTGKSYLTEMLNFLFDKKLIIQLPIEVNSCLPDILKLYERPSQIDVLTIELTRANYDLVKSFVHSEFAINIKTYRIFVNEFLDKVKLISLLKDICKDSPVMVMIHLSIAYKENSFDYDLQEYGLIYWNVSEKTNLKDLYSENYPKITFSLPQILESYKYNTYFNKNIFITGDGFLASHFNSTNKFNLQKIIKRQIDFHKLLKSQQLKELWSVNKDKIEICKLCELRHICIDNRIPIKKGHYYYSSECGYNPFIAKWDTEPDFYPISECGTYNENGKFEIDMELVNQLNKRLWMV